MIISNSSRLSYRLMDANDIEPLFQLDQDPAVMRFISGGVPTSKEQIESVFIPRMESYRSLDKGWGLWQVNVTQTDDYIGWILVRPMFFFSSHPEFDNLEIGWRFFQSAWGKGYASEAAGHLIQQLSGNKNIKHFSAIADKDNIASISVMKKVGMQYVKTYTHKDPLFEAEVIYYQVKSN